jgi:hypothetical protein
VDLEQHYRSLAVKAVGQHLELIKSKGAKWAQMIKVIEEALPEGLDRRNDKAANLVAPTLNELLGPREWHTRREGGRPLLILAGRRE